MKHIFGFKIYTKSKKKGDIFLNKNQNFFVTFYLASSWTVPNTVFSTTLGRVLSRPVGRCRPRPGRDGAKVVRR